jgi:Glycosyl transferase 4-like domain
MAADVLYISFDGVLQPLAFSQVARVVAGLANRGLRYHLLSVERPSDAEKPDLRRAVEDLLRPKGVGWTPMLAESMGSPRRASSVVLRAVAQAARLARGEGVGLVHARSYHGALVAYALKRLTGIPYLFDARGYWIEERAHPGGWFSTSSTYAMGKFAEQVLFRAADGVVTLTELQASDLAAGLFGRPPRLLEVIPTCADYAAFYLRDSRPAKPDGGRVVPGPIRSRLADKVVLGVVGALNGTYCVRETLALAKFATQSSPSVHLLILSAQEREYEAALESADIPVDRCTVASARHWEMPEWLQWLDWGLLLIPETAANRAKMPTKLAEFFAAGVRPVFFGCNPDAARWVERAGSVIDPKVLRVAREATELHFGLNSGLDRYARFVRACAHRDG